MCYKNICEGPCLKNNAGHVDNSQLGAKSSLIISAISKNPLTKANDDSILKMSSLGLIWQEP